MPLGRDLPWAHLLPGADPAGLQSTIHWNMALSQQERARLQTLTATEGLFVESSRSEVQKVLVRVEMKSLLHHDFANVSSPWGALHCAAACLVVSTKTNLR